jgi:DNA-binding MarR family transcriptional regulator
MSEVPKFPKTEDDFAKPRDYSTGMWVQIPAPLLELAVKIHDSRSLRSDLFSDDVVGEAPWNMLLALYIAHGRGYRLKVSDLCYESQVPATTALRWIEHLVNQGWAQRRPNMLDARSFLVEITEQGLTRMTSYLCRTSEILSR